MWRCNNWKVGWLRKEERVKHALDSQKCCGFRKRRNGKENPPPSFRSNEKDRSRRRRDQMELGWTIFFKERRLILTSSRWARWALIFSWTLVEHEDWSGEGYRRTLQLRRTWIGEEQRNFKDCRSRKIWVGTEDEERETLSRPLREARNRRTRRWVLGCYWTEPRSPLLPFMLLLWILEPWTLISLRLGSLQSHCFSDILCCALPILFPSHSQLKCLAFFCTSKQASTSTCYSRFLTFSNSCLLM